MLDSYCIFVIQTKKLVYNPLAENSILNNKRLVGQLKFLVRGRLIAQKSHILGSGYMPCLNLLPGVCLNWGGGIDGRSGFVCSFF